MIGLVVGRIGVGHTLGQKYPGSALEQEVGRYAAERFQAAHVEDEVGIASFPSHPALHIGGTSIETVGKGLFGDGLIAGLGFADPDHLGPCRLVGVGMGQKACGVEATIVFHRVVALIELRHAIAGGFHSEVFHLAGHGLSVVTILGAGYFEFTVLNGETGHLHSTQEGRVVAYGSLSFVEEFGIGAHELMVEHPVFVRHG